MIKPVNNNLLIKIIENETVTKQGLIIKNDKNEDIKRGKIIKISDDIIDNNLKENIEIIFSSEDSNTIFYNNQNYILIDKDKILGIIE